MSLLPPGSLSLSPLDTLRFIRAPDDYFRERFSRLGDPFCAHLPPGKVFVTADPEGAREVFSADPDTFEPLAGLLVEPVTGPHSLILLAGEQHKRERRLLMPPFHGERMRAYGQLMQQSALEQLAGRKDGGVFAAQDLTQAVSLDVIIRAVFGVEGEARVQQFREVLGEYVEAFTPALALVKGLRQPFGGLGPWARFKKLYDTLDGMLDAQLAERRAARGTRDDILSLLLDTRDEHGQPLSDGDVKDELRTMLMAGHDTTAIGMAWALYYLHREPQVLARLREELAPLGPTPAPEALARLPYLTAVCDEALRIHPVLHLVSRRVVRPFTLRGFQVPVGMGVMVSIVQLHADPRLYPEPGRFRPERFLERRFTPFEYMPFGGGARRCIGAAFALYEMKVVLGSLLAARVFRLEDEAPVRPVRRNVTMGPGRAVSLRVLGAPAAAQVRPDAA